MVNNFSSNEEQVEFVRNAPYFIKYIQNPSIEVQLAAVNQDVYAIVNIKNLDESIIEMYFESDELNDWSIENIYNQTKQDHIKVYLKMKYPDYFN